MSKHKAESNDLPCSKSFWVGGGAAWFAWIASIVLAGPKLGFWSSLPGCGPQSGCDLVTNGPLGNISLGGFLWPVSFVGIAWFVSIAALWMNTRGTSKSLLWFVRLGVLGSLGFVIAMIVGGHFCKWCALVHFFNLVLWICAELRIRSTKNVWGSGDAKSFVFLLVSTSLFIGVLYLFASSKKSADDKKAGEENVSEIINPAADSSTLALLESKHRFGSPDAPIQVVVFTDYQCPDCKRYETELARIYKQRKDLSIVVKHFPFNFDCNDEIGSMKLHANACWAARAAETAYILGGDSGWERMHTWLFENGGSFTDATFDGDLIALGFNPKEFVATMKSQITLNNVKSDAVDGRALGILFTPMIFINGVEYLWYYGEQDSLARVIESVGVAVASGQSTGIAPPSALEKLIEDWRTRKFQEYDGLSWSGVGSVEIIVWGDYQSEYTQRLDGVIKDVLASDARIAYSFRHFPIDGDCNIKAKNYKPQYAGSCAMAMVVEAVDLLCGNEARWQVHDAFMFEQPSVDLDSLAEVAASICDNSKELIISVASSEDVERRLRTDIQSKPAWRSRVPMLVIDGRFVPRWEMGGTTAKETILQMIDEASK